LEPPFTADLAKAVMIQGGEFEVDYGLDFEETVQLISHLPFKMLELHHSVKELTGKTHIMREELSCGRAQFAERGFYHSSVSPGTCVAI
jgi:hypothetical protein